MERYISIAIISGVLGYMCGFRSAFPLAEKAAWKFVEGSCYTSPDGYCFSERHKGACYNK